jgi:hypothetical protein
MYVCGYVGACNFGFNFGNLMSEHNTIGSKLYNKEAENNQIFLPKKSKPRILALCLTPEWE